ISLLRRSSCCLHHPYSATARSLYANSVTATATSNTSRATPWPATSKGSPEGTTKTRAMNPNFDENDRKHLHPAWCAGCRSATVFALATLSCRRSKPLPVDLQLLASAKNFEACGDKILDASQVFLVGGFGAQRQRVRGGLHGPLAPAQPHYPVSVGPFDVLHLGRRITADVSARPLA